MEETRYPLHIRHPYLGETNCREISHDGDLYILEDETEEFLVFKLLTNEEKECWLDNHLQLYKLIYEEEKLPYLPVPILVEETTTGRFFADLQVSMVDFESAKKIVASIVEIRTLLCGKVYEEGIIRDAIIRLPLLWMNENRKSLIPIAKNNLSETEWNLEVLCTYQKEDLEKWYNGNVADAPDWAHNIPRETLYDAIQKYNEEQYASLRGIMDAKE